MVTVPLPLRTKAAIPKLWLYILLYHTVGPDSSVGIAIRYGLGGPGIEFRCGRDFPHRTRTALWPTRPPCVPGLFPGG